MKSDFAFECFKAMDFREFSKLQNNLDAFTMPLHTGEKIKWKIIKFAIFLNVEEPAVINVSYFLLFFVIQRNLYFYFFEWFYHSTGSIPYVAFPKSFWNNFIPRNGRNQGRTGYPIAHRAKCLKGVILILNLSSRRHIIKLLLNIYCIMNPPYFPLLLIGMVEFRKT